MMMALNFNEIIEKVLELPLEEKMELIDLLEQQIAEGRQDEIAQNYKEAQSDLSADKMNFSSDIDELQKML
jgi:hypothetical protein